MSTRAEDRTAFTGRESFAYGAAAALAMLVYLFVLRAHTGIPSSVELFAGWLSPKLPLRLFEAGISTLGGLAKPLLSLGISLAVLVVGGLLGIAYARARARYPARSGPELLAAGWAVLFAVAMVVFLPLVGRGPFGASSGEGVVGSALYYGSALALYAACLGILFGLGTRPRYDTSRRRLMRNALYGIGMLLGLGVVTSFFNRSLGVTLTDLRKNASGLPPRFTPTRDFYEVSKNLVDPKVKASGWRLTIVGMVDHPFSLTLDELRRMPSVRQDQTLECISNPIGGNLISNAHWRGVRLRDLLERARVQKDVVDLKLSCADGYTDSIPIRKAMEPDVLVAYEINGELLPYQHGAPARLLVPNIYGMKNAKWLTRIEAVPTDYVGYWEQQGWSDTARIQTMSEIRSPAPGSTVGAGRPVEVAGLAFAGSRGIRKVEWSADGGRTWREAELEPQIGELCWRFWRATWTPPRPGSYTLAVRATDGTGRTQTSAVTPTLPSGATGYHEVGVTAS